MKTRSVFTFLGFLFIASITEAESSPCSQDFPKVGSMRFRMIRKNLEATTQKNRPQQASGRYEALHPETSEDHQRILSIATQQTWNQFLEATKSECSKPVETWFGLSSRPPSGEEKATCRNRLMQSPQSPESTSARDRLHWLDLLEWRSQSRRLETLAVRLEGNPRLAPETKQRLIRTASRAKGFPRKRGLIERWELEALNKNWKDGVEGWIETLQSGHCVESLPRIDAKKAQTQN